MTRFLFRSLLAAAVAASPVPAAVAADAPVAAKANAAVGAVKIESDLAYAKDDDRQKIDLYLPEGKKDFPVVLFLHGGGFSKGDRKEAAKFGNALAQQGIGVAAAGYRLAPQSRHPDQIQDAAKAFAWLHANIRQHGGDADALFVAGHSAGGLLAALLGSDDQYLKAEHLELKNLRGVISLSGLYRIPEERKEIFGDESSRAKASPIAYAKAGLPPFLLVFAEKDAPGRDADTRAFAAALTAAKVENQVVEAKDRDHSSVFNRIEGNEAIGQLVIDFVRKNSAKK